MVLHLTVCDASTSGCISIPIRVGVFCV